MQCHVSTGRPHEAAQVVVEIVDFLDKRHDLHDRGLMPGVMAEIRVQHGFDLAPPRKDGAPEFLQVRPTLAERGRAVAQEGGSLKGKDLVEPAADFICRDRAHGLLQC
jgi:hypothetical protein